MAGGEAAVSAVGSVPIPGVRFTVPAGRLEDDLVWQILGLLDRSKLLATIEAWETVEHSGPGGRPKTFPVRALLVAMVLCARDRPAHARHPIRGCAVSPDLADHAPRPRGPEATRPDDHRGWDNCYRNVRTRFHALIELMDPSPAPKNRRLTTGDL